jgi:NADPH:quinone reductase-like Zn-dependent oxidoreductase
VVDYTTHGITDDGTRYDVVVDIGGNRAISELRRAMTPKGTLVIVGGEEGGRWLGGMGRPLGATLLSVFVAQRMGTFVASEAAADLDVLRELVEAGVVRVALDRVCAPEEVAGALADMAAGRIRGKAVVRFGERHAG